MKRLVPVRSDKWLSDVFTDTIDPTSPQAGVPAPEEPFSPEPAVNRGMTFMQGAF